MPPNTQGLTALLWLNLLEGFDVRGLGHNSAEYLHLLVETKKLAFADRARHIADPAFYQAPLAQLLSKEYAAGLRKRIDRSRTAAESTSGPGAAKTRSTSRSWTRTVMWFRSFKASSALSDPDW